MMTMDAAFDEYRGGPPNLLNLISSPKHQEFHKATRDAIPWTECEHDAERVATPSILIEKMFRGKRWWQSPQHLPSKGVPVPSNVVGTRCSNFEVNYYGQQANWRRGGGLR